ncbi:hypothetical protein N658DRAFT_325623 [Parathielavia hyrcaniae]|uniref:Uncharacterized protein n=1 Tax=Parathielavia hyrcaniae TaxID=113614 RepID=A0AAN6T2M2_9PEZI|nr:hypothetical protein N658DRAFT_325623 [Parathielavia hyrcaniae]
MGFQIRSPLPGPWLRPLRSLTIPSRKPRPTRVCPIPQEQRNRGQAARGLFRRPRNSGLLCCGSYGPATSVGVGESSAPTSTSRSLKTPTRRRSSNGPILSTPSPTTHLPHRNCPDSATRPTSSASGSDRAAPSARHAHSSRSATAHGTRSRRPTPPTWTWARCGIHSNTRPNYLPWCFPPSTSPRRRSRTSCSRPFRRRAPSRTCRCRDRPRRRSRRRGPQQVFRRCASSPPRRVNTARRRCNQPTRFHHRHHHLATTPSRWANSSRQAAIGGYASGSPLRLPHLLHHFLHGTQCNSSSPLATGTSGVGRRSRRTSRSPTPPSTATGTCGSVSSVRSSYPSRPTPGGRAPGAAGSGRWGGARGAMARCRVRLLSWGCACVLGALGGGAPGLVRGRWLGDWLWAGGWVWVLLLAMLGPLEVGLGLTGGSVVFMGEECRHRIGVQVRLSVIAGAREC